MKHKKTVSAVAAGLGLAAILAAGPTAAMATTGHGGGHTPVTICHNGHTITVDDSSLKAHLHHGDTLGPCAPATEEPAPEPDPTEPPVVTPPVETPEPTTPPVTEEPTPEPTDPEPTTPPTEEPCPEPTTPTPTEPTEPEPTTPPVTEPPTEPETPEPTTPPVTEPPATPEPTQPAVIVPPVKPSPTSSSTPSQQPTQPVRVTTSDVDSSSPAPAATDKDVTSADGELAYTGFNPWPVAGVMFIILAIGTSLVFVGRRMQRSER